MCAVALAECFRGDGEILANPIGTLPTIGGRLAKATFEPALVMTDGEALLVENILPVGVDAPEKVVSGYNPYRTMFDVVWSGRRHIIMGGSQIDPYGNQNFAFIGPTRRSRPTQLLGMRGAPGNTINNKTSLLVRRTTRTRVMVPEGDVVSGVGNDRAANLGGEPSRVPRARARRHQPLRLRLRDARPADAAAFGAPGRDRRRRRGRDRIRARDPRRRCPRRACPTDEELRWIREVIDPLGLGEKEVPNP